ncbi:MAG: T9SS type A sorting domain-containing protein, partial [Bacteroidetes bacterium]|nr:T9SS type A sorting domain-containing protein [Bacteroidota bacterium]
IGTDQTICNGATPALLTSTTDGTGTGTITYEWYTSADGYVAIQVTASTYQPPALTATTSYKRRTKAVSGATCYSGYTATVTITVNAAVTAGAIGTVQTICNGATPALLTSTTDGTGTGTITYEWYTSADGYVAIQGTASTYQPPALTATTSYKRRTKAVSGATCYSGYTATVTITVNAAVTAGAIGTDQTICNGCTPALLTSTTDGTGTGTITYEWYTSADGYVAIQGTASTYQPPALTATTSYKRRTKAVSGATCYSGYTATVTITISTDQGVTNNGATIYINNATMYIDGDASGSFLNYQSGSNYGAVTIVNNGIIKFEGSWGNYAGNGNGVFGTAPANGYVVMAGTTAQTLKGDYSTNFYNLQITNSNGATLNQAENVYGILTLTSGKITTTSSNLLTMQAGSSVPGGASNTSFVNGPVKKIGNTNFTFPTGKNSDYQAIAISGITGGATDAFTAEYFGANPQTTYGTAKDASINHLSQCEYWVLNQSSGTPTAVVEITFDANSCSVTNLSDLIVARWNGSQWKDHTGACTNCNTGNTSAGTAYSNGAITSFSPITFGSKTSSNPLPIELLSFNAICKNNIVNLNWQTASEINNDYFTIERCTDEACLVSKNWETVTTIKGAGNSNTPLTYATYDLSPYTGTSYYRLLQTDYDGQQKYFDPVAVSCIDEGTVSGNDFGLINIYLDKPGKEIKIIYNSPKEGEAIYLSFYNTIGQEIIRETVYTGTGINSINISDPGLVTGIYIISIINNNTKITRKIVIE